MTQPNKSQLPLLKVFVDATFDKKTGESIYGYIDRYGTVQGYGRNHFDSINDAEWAAAHLALTRLGNQVEINTDSAFVVDNWKVDIPIVKIASKDNLANMYVRIIKEGI